MEPGGCRVRRRRAALAEGRRRFRSTAARGIRV